MDGASALKLAYRVLQIVDLERHPETGEVIRVRSSLWSAIESDKKEAAEEEEVMRVEDQPVLSLANVEAMAGDEMETKEVT